MRIRIARILVAAGLIVPAVARGQADPPRIALALGGGGARGAAHVGVLRVLEEQRVPVHAIAGTSMGAVIGGLYAAGMSPDEIERALTEIDWMYAFSDKTSRELLSFRRKQDDARLKVRARLGLKDGRVSLPRGFLQGQKLELLLRQLLLPVTDIDDFDRLQIPFRAVAADLETGEPVVLDSGDLADAIRASMSLPGILEPVELNGRLLVDGGIASNVPIEVARSLGADVVIAVDVNSEPVGRDELANPLVVANQVITLLVNRETERQKQSLGADDLLLEPELGDMAPYSFTELSQAIEAGAEAARRATETLAQWSAPSGALADEPDVQQDTTAVTVAEVRVDSDTDLKPRYITSRMHTEVGQALDPEQLLRDLDRVYGMGVWQSVSFDLHAVEGAPQPSAALEIKAREKAWGTSFLRAGVDLATDFRGSTSFDLGARITALPVNRMGGEWRTDLSVGELTLLASELYQPINAGGVFVAPRISYRADNVPLSVEGQTTEARLKGTSVGTDIGFEFDTWGELRVGVSRHDLGADALFGAPQSVDFDLALATMRFTADTLDDTSFPTRGWFGEFVAREGLRSFGGTIDDRFLELQLLGARTWGRHTLNLGVSGAGAVNDQPVLTPYALGDLFQLSGLRRNQLIGSSVFLARLVYQRQLGPDRLFGQPLYAGASLESGNAWMDPSAFSLSDLQEAGSLFLGLDTVIGPIYAGAGFGPDGGNEYYLRIGNVFRDGLSPLFE